MSKEELIAAAKARFAIGTVVHSPYSGVRIEIRNYNHINADEEGDVDYSGDYLYYQGKWAKIQGQVEPVIIDEFPIF